MLLNEDVKDQPNCKFKLDHLVVAMPIKKGEELTVGYGNAYNELRKKAGYTMANNPHRYDECPEYDVLTYEDYPTPKIRNDNIKKWNAVINNGEPCDKKKHVSKKKQTVAITKPRCTQKSNSVRKTGRRATKKELIQRGLVEPPEMTPTELYALLKRKVWNKRPE